MTDKKYVEIRFRLPIEYFEVYETEAKELEDKNGIKTSGTALVRAEAIKQAKEKLVLQKPKRKSVLDVFEGLE